MLSSATPTYSADRAKLPSVTCVASIEEVREAASSWDIVSSPGLRKRGGLDKVLASQKPNADGKYDLDKILKNCYEMAFHMPPSPSASQRSPMIAKPGSAAAPTPLAI